MQTILSLGVIIIGGYMLFTFDWPAPPALSGLAFLLIGFSMIKQHCNIFKK